MQAKPVSESIADDLAVKLYELPTYKWKRGSGASVYVETNELRFEMSSWVRREPEKVLGVKLETYDRTTGFLFNSQSKEVVLSSTAIESDPITRLYARVNAELFQYEHSHSVSPKRTERELADAKVRDFLNS